MITDLSMLAVDVHSSKIWGGYSKLTVCLLLGADRHQTPVVLGPQAAGPLPEERGFSGRAL